MGLYEPSLDKKRRMDRDARLKAVRHEKTRQKQAKREVYKKIYKEELLKAKEKRKKDLVLEHAHLVAKRRIAREPRQMLKKVSSGRRKVSRKAVGLATVLQEIAKQKKHRRSTKQIRKTIKKVTRKKVNRKKSVRRKTRKNKKR